MEGKSSLTYVDVTKGDPAYGSAVGNGGIQWHLDYGEQRTSAPTSLAVRLPTGEPLTPGHTYALIMHDITQMPGDAPIGATTTSRRCSQRPRLPTRRLSSAYAAYRPFRDYLAETKSLICRRP